MGDNFEFNDSLNGEGEGSSDLEKEEEQRDKNMADQDLDWMAQGPNSLPNNHHGVPRHPKKLLSKFYPNKNTKVEDHINDFYMHLWMLGVRYDDVACRFFPFTIEGRESTWYHRLVNLVHV